MQTVNVNMNNIRFYYKIIFKKALDIYDLLCISLMRPAYLYNNLTDDIFSYIFLHRFVERVSYVKNVLVL